ncbi:DegV family protein [Longirhabdus pacifica]|uniref:DegV family protein n=1 Tax=Longirhabdus pacifica TaxID=2305227 RepID=UPI001008C12F|nr:DegV family protein [Longirhabdus pacifica]
MGDIVIMSDSASDLPPEIIKEHNIKLIPFHITLGESVYKDGVEITPQQLFSEVEELKSLPKTAAISPADYVQHMQPYIEQGRKVLYISLSSEISSTYQNAFIAKQSFAEGAVEVVDSRSLSSGIGLLVLEAVEYVKEGMQLQHIASELRRLSEQVQVEFVIDTLDYLHKGGRCSSVQLLLGSMLKIHPLIAMENGSMMVAEKWRGKRNKMLQNLVQRTTDTTKITVSGNHMFITHTTTDEHAQWLKDELQKHYDMEIHIVQAGSVISSHCGPDTIGVIYMTSSQPSKN